MSWSSFTENGELRAVFIQAFSCFDLAENFSSKMDRVKTGHPSCHWSSSLQASLLRSLAAKQPQQGLQIKLTEIWFATFCFLGLRDLTAKHEMTPFALFLPASVCMEKRGKNRQIKMLKSSLHQRKTLLLATYSSCWNVSVFWLHLCCRGLGTVELCLVRGGRADPEIPSRVVVVVLSSSVVSDSLRPRGL